MARATPRLLGSLRRLGGRAPRAGRPPTAVSPIGVLVLRDEGVVVVVVAGDVLVVDGGDRQARDVRLDQVVLVLLVQEGDGAGVDQLLLGLAVRAVAVGLVQAGVGLLDQAVVPGQVHAAP